jgi:hypothetical protein
MTDQNESLLQTTVLHTLPDGNGEGISTRRLVVARANENLSLIPASTTVIDRTRSFHDDDDSDHDSLLGQPFSYSFSTSAAEAGGTTMNTGHGSAPPAGGHWNGYERCDTSRPLAATATKGISLATNHTSQLDRSGSEDLECNLQNWADVESNELIAHCSTLTAQGVIVLNSVDDVGDVDYTSYTDMADHFCCSLLNDTDNASMNFKFHSDLDIGYRSNEELHCVPPHITRNDDQSHLESCNTVSGNNKTPQKACNISTNRFSRVAYAADPGTSSGATAIDTEYHCHPNNVSASVGLPSMIRKLNASQTLGPTYSESHHWANTRTVAVKENEVPASTHANSSFRNDVVDRLASVCHNVPHDEAFFGRWTHRRNGAEPHNNARYLCRRKPDTPTPFLRKSVNRSNAPLALDTNKANVSPMNYPILAQKRCSTDRVYFERALFSELSPLTTSESNNAASKIRPTDLRKDRINTSMNPESDNFIKKWPSLKMSPPCSPGRRRSNPRAGSSFRNDVVSPLASICQSLPYDEAFFGQWTNRRNGAEPHDNRTYLCRRQTDTPTPSLRQSVTRSTAPLVLDTDKENVSPTNHPNLAQKRYCNDKVCFERELLSELSPVTTPESSSTVSKIRPTDLSKDRINRITTPQSDNPDSNNSVMDSEGDRLTDFAEESYSKKWSNFKRSRRSIGDMSCGRQYDSFTLLSLMSSLPENLMLHRESSTMNIQSTSSHDDSLHQEMEQATPFIMTDHRCCLPLDDTDNEGMNSDIAWEHGVGHESNEESHHTSPHATTKDDHVYSESGNTCSGDNDTSEENTDVSTNPSVIVVTEGGKPLTTLPPTLYSPYHFQSAGTGEANKTGSRLVARAPTNNLSLAPASITLTGDFESSKSNIVDVDSDHNNVFCGTSLATKDIVLATDHSTQLDESGHKDLEETFRVEAGNEAIELVAYHYRTPTAHNGNALNSADSTSSTDCLPPDDKYNESMNSDFASDVGVGHESNKEESECTPPVATTKDDHDHLESGDTLSGDNDTSAENTNVSANPSLIVVTEGSEPLTTLPPTMDSPYRLQSAGTDEANGTGPRLVAKDTDTLYSLPPAATITLTGGSESSQSNIVDVDSDHHNVICGALLAVAGAGTKTKERYVSAPMTRSQTRRLAQSVSTKQLKKALSVACNNSQIEMHDVFVANKLSKCENKSCVGDVIAE